MRIFLDANILVSVLNKEYPLFTYSSRIISLADNKKFTVWGVAEVGVEVDIEVISACNGVPHPGEDGRAKPLLPGAVEDFDRRQGGLEVVGDLAGAVGGVVVDDEDRRM